MFTKRNFVSILVAAVVLALPSLSFAQPVYYYEEYNDMGTPCGYTSLPTLGFIWAEKMHPFGTFIIDSVKFAVYCYSGATPTFTFKIRLYEDTLLTVTSNDCPGGAVDCDGPGLQRWASPNLVTPTMTEGQWYWFTFNVPDCTFYWDFIIGIEVVQPANEPSLMMDCTTGGPPCCYNFYKYGSTWYEHWDFWGPQEVGYNMIRCKGWGYSPPPPPPPEFFFGHAAIAWLGGPEMITDEYIFNNVGGQTDTITAITSTNPDFTWTGDPLPWYLEPGESKVIDIHFQTIIEGWRYGNLVVTRTQSGPFVPDTIELSGIGYLGHWLENFYECEEWDPICGPWYVGQDSCTDDGWMLYSGGYADQGCCMGHTYTDPGCMAFDWLVSSPLKNPNNGGIKVSWMNRNLHGDHYFFHALYWTAPDCVYYYYVDEIPPTTEGQWEGAGPYYIQTYADSIQLAFLYAGENADAWFIDDIMVDTLIPPPLPPLHEHHTDDGPATWIDPNCIHITATENFYWHMNYLNLWYTDHATHIWNSIPMTPVPGCLPLYEALMCGLETCHTYGYYFEVNYPEGSFYLPAGAPDDHFHVDILDNTATQMAYDNGTVWYVRYDPDYWETRFAVRFTPATYPYTLGGAMVRIGAPYVGFPDDDHEDIVVELFDDNAAGGKPGTMIGTPYMNNGTSWNEGADACDDTTFAKWVYVKIDPCVTITDGDFYIAVRNRDGSLNRDKEAFAYDTGPAVSPYRTWIFYADIGRWGLDTLGDAGEPPGPSTNLMLRAIECACPSMPPTDVTILYNDTTGNVELRWTDMPSYLSYKIYRSTYDPFLSDSFAVIATVAAGIQSYADPVGTKSKAFYCIHGSCNPPTVAPSVPPSEPMATVSAVRVPGAGRTAALAIGQKWTLEGQLEMGILPKTISKKDLARRATGETKVKSQTGKLMERFPRMSH